MMKLLSHAATVLHVKDLAASLSFYQDKLGFTVTFQWQEPPTYAILKRDEAVQIHLSQREGAEIQKELSGTSIYIFAYDVDALYQEFLDKDVAIEIPIANQDYGMRDFDVRDPDGNQLTFGMEAGR